VETIMKEDEPIILNYATPKPSDGFAGMPEIVIVLLAIIVPGLSSSLIRGSPWRCILLIAAVPMAFVFFGPFWDEVLFRSTRLRNFGLYPFLVTCAAVEIISVVLALSDRKKTMNEIRP
jgi:hypothetical protein